MFFSDTNTVLLEDLKPFTEYEISVRANAETTVSQYSEKLLIYTESGGRSILLPRLEEKIVLKYYNQVQKKKLYVLGVKITKARRKKNCLGF